ncbi:abscission/NoCut checkpoint regulator isoform X2 [Pieris rapae]|uniref:abscission/NoCut checkpoint regulator isoform X2 n=1 Tax=Pieris rapae TaxID=64459 RepID=UPI001E27DD11|nr:abscission/NoCut checkpoint regulator isoform X2 [Pieris rapae]
MSCNTCCKTFSMIRKEKGCPSCGFSYCSKCLNYKLFLPKLNSDAKVCGKCKNNLNSKHKVIEPPAAYFKRIESPDVTIGHMDINKNDPVEEEIRKRLLKLKEDKLNLSKCTDKDIAERLKKLKDIPSTSQAQVEQRLANIKEVPLESIQSKAVLPTPDLRTEEEQANDLLRQYLAHASIDKKYEDEFKSKINDIEGRLYKLKGQQTALNSIPKTDTVLMESDDEVIRKIIDKAKVECDDELATPINNELPFCEICNEDAVMRCLGCKYLFCKLCFTEHKDDEDGCDKYEKYTAPPNV